MKKSSMNTKKLLTGAVLGAAATYVGLKVYNVMTDKGLDENGDPYYEDFDPEDADIDESSKDYTEVPAQQNTDNMEHPADAESSTESAETEKEETENV